DRVPRDRHRAWPARAGARAAWRAPCGCSDPDARAAPRRSRTGSACPRRARRACAGPPRTLRVPRVRAGPSQRPRRRSIPRNMIIAKRLVGKAIATWLGPTGEAARRAITSVRERITNEPRTLDVYLDIADPWS